MRRGRAGRWPRSEDEEARRGRARGGPEAKQIWSSRGEDEPTRTEVGAMGIRTGGRDGGDEAADEAALAEALAAEVPRAQDARWQRHRAGQQGERRSGGPRPPDRDRGGRREGDGRG